MGADGYERWRQIHENISSSVAINSDTTTVTPLAGRTLYTILPQKVYFDVISAGPSGSKWRITDTNGTVLTVDVPADVEAQTVRDLGPKGRACKEGEGLVVSCDAGASGVVSWDGYRKLTGVGAA